MANVNLPAGLSVDEDQGILTIQYKGRAFPGFMAIFMAGGFLAAIGLRLLLGPVEGDVSFALVFGPILSFVVFLGVRMVVNTTSITADGPQIVVKVRPLPLRPARRLSVADLQSIEVKRETQTGKGGTKIYYSVVANHRDERTTRLLRFKGLEFKEPTHFLKEKLEKKCRLHGERGSLGEAGPRGGSSGLDGS